MLAHKYLIASYDKHDPIATYINSYCGESCNIYACEKVGGQRYSLLLWHSGVSLKTTSVA